MPRWAAGKGGGGNTKGGDDSTNPPSKDSWGVLGLRRVQVLVVNMLVVALSSFSSLTWTQTPGCAMPCYTPTASLFAGKNKRRSSLSWRDSAA
jgi:hypothetical protein